MRHAPDLSPDFSAVRGRRLLIALSGGCDSVALTVLLWEARREYELQLTAAHVDHGIRPESAEDAAFCRALCARLDISFLTVRVDVPAEAARRRIGLEEAARELRYQELRRFRDETGADCIALAHHMDDQAETVLMHLGRGAGPRGLCAMRELSDGLYRPLLGFRRDELREYLVSRGFSWREDATNLVDDNPRNALRLHAIPELEKCYPQFVRAAARYARSAQIESDFLDALTRDFLAERSGTGFACRWIELSRPAPRALLRRALMDICPVEAFGFDPLNALEALCLQRRGRIDLSADWFAERAGSRIYFVQKRPEAIEPAPLSLKGETVLAPLGTIVATPCAPVPIRDDPSRQVLNPVALQGAVVRTRRDGDRIRPLGCGDRLLSDYLIDKKVDRPLRDGIALVAVGHRVHWVAGCGISQEAAVEPGGDAVLLEYNDCLQRRNEHAE